MQRFDWELTQIELLLIWISQSLFIIYGLYVLSFLKWETPHPEPMLKTDIK